MPALCLIPFRLGRCGSALARPWLLALALLGLLLAAGLQTSPARAHGVEGQVIPCRTVTFLAAYSDGEPMTYSDAVVMAPGGGELPFLRGRTDRLGRLAFCPDQPGDWRVEVVDGMGHKLVQTVSVAAPEPASAQPAGPAASTPAPAGLAALPFYLKLLVGLSLVFGLAGVAVLFKRRPGKAGRS